MSNLEDTTTNKDLKEQEAFEHHQQENGGFAGEQLEGGRIVDRERLEKRLLRKLDARFSM